MSSSRPRLTEQETRARLLEVAHERLLTQGLTVGLDAIRMEQVIADAGVSRASAYRCWTHRDDFLADVLVQAVQGTTLLAERSEDIDRLVDLVAAHLDQLANPQDHRDVVVEALRISVDADIRRLLASREWRLFMALSVTHTTLPDAALRETVRESLAVMERAFVARRAEVYRGMADLIGYRQRAPWSGDTGWQLLSEQAGLTMRGVLSRALGDPGWLDARTECNPFGASRPARWSSAEIALTTVVLTHLEPDPHIEWTPNRIARALEQFAAMSASLGHEVQLDHPAPTEGGAPDTADDTPRAT